MESTVTIIDAGGRYGVYPAWKEFFHCGDVRYVAFEPDPEEAARLARKYAADGGRYKVEATALTASEGTATMTVTRHRGATSLYRPAASEVHFSSFLGDCAITTGTIEVPTMPLDQYCKANGLSVDFLKADVEGAELGILEGGREQISHNVAGIWISVHFNKIFEGAPLFTELSAALVGAGFYLVNIDYDGRGIARNAFVRRGRYGILTGCYSLWLRRLPLLEAGGAATMSSADVGMALKQALIAMHHSAEDTGMEILLRLARRHQDAFGPWRATPLVAYLASMVERLFRELRLDPAYSEESLAETFAEIFGYPMKRRHEFFQSDEINPR